ncbi:hypothetical protein [Saccharibacillus endophyticus]|uniref:Uncharacterized protein n=1 Tax=Saccharibacillus endophyticus TaxID=2060666 RepID=A0ABQ1ZXK2_9BACL|nr:hypothetical protein [Saccharibacillus endophyticus]GGH79242.1 hypothetical protein GCM10007362_25740 [Saccharibacillus endophyticus]
MNIKKIAFSGVAAAMILGSAVASAAGTSSATIGYYDTGANGSAINMLGAVSLQGYNSASSDNTLWVNLKRRDGGIDNVVTNTHLNKSQSTNWNYQTGAQSYQYYINLDPNGTLYDSCIGSGSATN